MADKQTMLITNFSILESLLLDIVYKKLDARAHKNIIVGHIIIRETINSSEVLNIIIKQSVMTINIRK